MKFKAQILLAFFIFLGVTAAGHTSDMQNTAGSERMLSSKNKMQVSLPLLVGPSSDILYHNYIGIIGVNKARFTVFLSTGFPKAVQVAPGSLGAARLVPVPDHSMVLAWTDGTNQVPVHYKVYFGDSPAALSLIQTEDSRTYPLSNLTTAHNYYWQINTYDDYGRNTNSATFTFSLAPDWSNLYCAPNPFRAGAQPTVFSFQASAGSASMKIYSLPHGDLVFSTQLNGLVDGPNLWTYDGRDGRGAVLFNGVYMAVLESPGHDKAKFKFIVAK